MESGKHSPCSVLGQDQPADRFCSPAHACCSITARMSNTIEELYHQWWSKVEKTDAGYRCSRTCFGEESHVESLPSCMSYEVSLPGLPPDLMAFVLSFVTDDLKTIGRVLQVCKGVNEQVAENSTIWGEILEEAERGDDFHPIVPRTKRSGVNYFLVRNLLDPRCCFSCNRCGLYWVDELMARICQDCLQKSLHRNLAVSQRKHCSDRGPAVSTGRITKRMPAEAVQERRVGSWKEKFLETFEESFLRSQCTSSALRSPSRLSRRPMFPTTARGMDLISLPEREPEILCIPGQTKIGAPSYTRNGRAEGSAETLKAADTSIITENMDWESESSSEIPVPVGIHYAYSERFFSRHLLFPYVIVGRQFEALGLGDVNHILRFSSISDALQVALPGWTVFILGDTYHEHVLLDKEVHLQGIPVNGVVPCLVWRQHTHNPMATAVSCKVSDLQIRSCTGTNPFSVENDWALPRQQTCALYMCNAREYQRVDVRLERVEVISDTASCCIVDGPGLCVKLVDCVFRDSPFQGVCARHRSVVQVIGGLIARCAFALQPCKDEGAVIEFEGTIFQSLVYNIFV